MNKNDNDKHSHQDDKDGFSPEDFARALEESFVKSTYETGDRVRGSVVSITGEYVFLDIGGKSEGIIKIEEFIGGSGDLEISLGDIIECTVISTGDELVLSRKMSKKNQTREMLREAFENRIPVQGRVTGINKGGFMVDLGSQRAFCPISQMDTEYVSNPDTYVGKVFHFFISKYNFSGRDIVVSRSALLAEEARQQARETMKTLKPGVILRGKVKRITDFGVFVDIGGVDGLVHISELSWDRIDNPADVVHMGQEVSVKVLGIEDEERKRIRLSLREAQSNPWEDTEDILKQGKILEGEIRSTKRSGLEVLLGNGITGFVPASLTGLPRNENVMKAFHAGRQITVQIAEIDKNARRLILSIVNPDDKTGDMDFRDYIEKVRQEQSRDGEQKIGTLGLILAKALEQKKSGK